MTSRHRPSVIECGFGNISSVVNGCRRAGTEPVVAHGGGELLEQAPSHVILPGVGAVGGALSSLRERGLEDALNKLVIGDGVPFLGICVGMQMLGQVCEEFGEHEGLGWIPGRVGRLAVEGSELRLPHVGWNTLELKRPGDPLLEELDGKDVYFVHSYALDCPEEYVLATTTYGRPFVSAVRRGHIAGVQFHPEKSSALGAVMLSAFLGKHV